MGSFEKSGLYPFKEIQILGIPRLLSENFPSIIRSSGEMMVMLEERLLKMCDHMLLSRKVKIE